MDARATSNDKSRSANANSIFSLFSNQIKADQPNLLDHKVSGVTVKLILSKLREFDTSHYDDKPSHALIEIVSSYLVELTNVQSEFDALDDTMKSLILLLVEICVHAKKEILRYESIRTQFRIDIDLYDQKQKYFQLDKNVENEYQAALSCYSMRMQKIQEEVNSLDYQSASLATAKPDMNIKELAIYQKHLEDIAREIDDAEKIAKSINFFQYYCCYIPDYVKQAQKRIDELEAKLGFLKSASFTELKKYFLLVLESEANHKRTELKSIPGNKPVRDEQYREKYIEIEARVRSDELEYYSSISHELMLDFLKIYFIICKLQRIFNKKMPFHNLTDLFSRLQESYNSTVPSFYCEEPGRYYFSYYLKNMQSIKSNDALNKIIIGGAMVDELCVIMPGHANVSSPHEVGRGLG